MSAYFTIPPNIKIGKGSKKVYGSITYINLPNNRKLNTNFKKSRIFLALYKFHHGQWKLLDIKKCDFGEIVEVSRSDYLVEDHQMFLAVRLRKEFDPKNTIILPEPFSGRIDDSPVNERASLNLKYDGSETSYQGEYPYEMAKLKKGSLLSIDGSMRKIMPKIEKFYIFMNLNIDSRVNDEVPIFLFNPDNPLLKVTFKANKNMFSILNLKKISSKLDLSKSIFISSKNCSFIPLIFSVDKNSNQLSLEHTTPPADMFWGRDKFKIVRMIKNNWV